MDRMVSRGLMADDDEFEVGSDQPALQAPPARRRGPWLATTPWVLAAAALVVTGVVAAPEEGVSLDGYPPGTVGVLAVDATAPPEEMWRVAIEDWHGGFQSLGVAGETLILLTGDHATGLSLATGEERWQVPVDIRTCTVRATVACIEEQGEAGAHVVSIDPISADQQRIGLPYAVRAQGIDDDLIALTQQDDELELLRVDADGDPQWVTAVDLADWTIGTLGGDTSGGGYAAFIQLIAVGERVYLSVGPISVVVDVATGATIDHRDVYVFDSAYGFIRHNSASSTSTLLDDDGNVLVEDLPVAPDDDPDGPYEVQWDGLHLSIASDGEAVWESELEQDDVEMPLARVDGLLVTRTIRGSLELLSAREIPTGELLWTTSADVATAVLGAAGSTLLTAGQDHALAGIDARSGETLWTYGDTYATDRVLRPSGLVLLVGNEVVRLTWDRAATALW